MDTEVYDIYEGSGGTFLRAYECAVIIKNLTVERNSGLYGGVILAQTAYI